MFQVCCHILSCYLTNQLSISCCGYVVTSAPYVSAQATAVIPSRDINVHVETQLHAVECDLFAVYRELLT